MTLGIETGAGLSQKARRFAEMIDYLRDGRCRAGKDPEIRRRTISAITERENHDR